MKNFLSNTCNLKNSSYTSVCKVIYNLVSLVFILHLLVELYL